MDLNPIGKHCSLQTCNILDFLPIQCTCLQWFCQLHISPNLHDCSSLQQHPSQSSSCWKRSKCAFLGCNKPSLVTAIAIPCEEGSHDGVSNRCPGCQLAFCVDHRHMQSHSCTALATGKVNSKHAAAHAVLAQKFSGTSTLTSRTPMVARRSRDPPPNSEKLAHLQKVNLMKLRHKAVPGNSKDRGSVIPVDQRIHLIVRLEILGQSTKEITIWFRKTTITGKALDLMVHHFGVSHTASTLCLTILSPEVAGRVLQNHLELSEQLEDGAAVVLTDSLPNE